MIARCAARGASFALFFSFHAPFALAQPATAPGSASPGSAKPAEAKPADATEPVNPEQVELEESAPAPSPGDSAVTTDAGAPEPATDGDEAGPKRSPGRDFIEGRRRSASEEDEEPEERKERRVRVLDHRQSMRDEAPEPDDGLLGTHQDHFFLGIGARIGFIADEGLDPFSTTDAFSQVAISGGRTVFTDGDVSLALVLGWDYGVRSAKARGLATDIGVHRVSVGAEGRYHLLRRLYGYVRLAPGALHTWATVNEFETTAWAFSADASLGAAFELFGAKSGETNKPRGWVSVNGGYGFATNTDLSLTPAKGRNMPERTASLELAPLSMSGPFVGGAVSLTY